MTNRDEKLKKKLEFWIRFVKSFFLVIFFFFFLMLAWMRLCHYRIWRNISPRKDCTQAFTDEKLFSLLTTPSYNPKNSQSIGPIQRLHRFLFEQKLWIRISTSLFSKLLIKMYVSSIRNGIFILPPDLTRRARLCKWLSLLLILYLFTRNAYDSNLC